MEINSKQRSNLRSVATNIAPIGQIGKGGISANMLKSFSDALEAREIIKITVLGNADGTPRTLGEELAESLNAVCVAAIGQKIILYRKSERENFPHIEF